MIKLLEVLRRTPLPTIRKGVPPPPSVRAALLHEPVPEAPQPPPELRAPSDPFPDTFADTSMWVRQGPTTFYPWDPTGIEYSGIVLGDMEDMGPGTLNAVGLFINGEPIGSSFTTQPPSDGYAYALNDGQWVRVIEESGGNMTGPLYLPPADPTAANQAAHKQYIDQQVAAHEFPEAPLDGGNYNRFNGAWTRNMDGGTY